MSEPRHVHSLNPDTAPWLTGNGLWSPSPASPSSVITPPPPTVTTATAAASSSSPASPPPDNTAAARRSEEVLSRADHDDVSAPLAVASSSLLPRAAATMTERSASPVLASREDAPPKTQTSAVGYDAANAQQTEEEETVWVGGSQPSLSRDGDTAMWPPCSETAHTGNSQGTALRHTNGVHDDKEGHRGGREIAPSSPSLPTAEARMVEWTGCQHSDPPARYRDTPAYYCTYCSYTICQACFTLLPSDSPDARPSSPEPSSSSSLLRRGASLPAQREEEQPPRGPVEGGEMRRDAAGVVLPPAQSHAVVDVNWLDTVLHTTTATTAAAPPIPLLCHFCRHGHLVREEALLHEWCCEGPAPTERLHHGQTAIYATHNLQKYHFMRDQREARLVSTAPLQAQLLSVSPALLTERETSSSSAVAAVLSVQPCEETRATGRVVRDAAPENAQHPTRRSAVTSAITGTVRRHGKDGASHRRGRCVAVAAAPQLACEEGGSFTFSVHNPRLDVQLVWCGVNRQSREEAPSYAREGAGGVSSHAVGTAAVTVTPLLLWRCPPSLPGLPARPHRLHVPYGLYAFANLHALALYEARDIYRKATAQLIAAPGGGSSTGVDVTSPRLTAVTVAPASTLRPLLTVSILHHVAATVRPLSLSLPSAAVGSRRKRGRSVTPPPSPPSLNALLTVPSAPTAAAVQWPEGLASPELSLCVDHLLHGRSVAVYGVASKYFFLHHVACSAALKAYHVVTVDASLGRVATLHGSGTSAAGGINSTSGARRGAPSVAGSGEPGSAPSAMRQLLSVGQVLLRRLSDSTVLTAETRAAMTAAAAAAAAAARVEDATRAPQTHAQRRRRAEQEEAGDEEEEGAVQAGAPVARALLEGDAGRSPAMARDVTAAMLHHHRHRLQPSAVMVVDVDCSLSSSSAPPLREPSHTDGVTSREVQTPPHATPSRCDTPTSHTRVFLAGCTPLSQRVHATQLGQTPPLPSPIPAFFAALQRSVSDGDDLGKGALRDEDSVTPAREEKHRCRHDWTELPEYFGPLNSLRLPPLPSRVGSPGGVSGAAPSSSSSWVKQRWRAAPVVYANDAVRRHVLQGLRRQHATRRCVRWASLPSPTAAAQLAEQGGREGQPFPSASPTLMAAHAVRPGWQPPVLLVLHNVDRLEASEAAVLLQLCARFAFPQPHLQLLLSFDDPLWPLGGVAAALARLGVCAVQLRSLLLPRVHETLHVSSVHLLTDFEAATAAAAGGGGGRKKASGSSLTSAAGGGGGSGVVGGAGTSHLLQDTLRRVLFSLPPAFNALLRIVLDVQDDVGEGVFVSLFTITERFEASGVMVSQGRLKALLRELTSNRIARYDSAEHALMVPQVCRLRRVLDEVTAQRERGGGGDGGKGPGL